MRAGQLVPSSCGARGWEGAAGGVRRSEGLPARQGPRGRPGRSVVGCVQAGRAKLAAGGESGLLKRV